MHKFILLRGHQGSGKSTFAREKIADFQKIFPNALIVHIENDHLMTDENGVYHFSSANLENAKKIGLETTIHALEIAHSEPQKNILIINSNTNQNSAACHNLITLVKKYKFEIEIYRLHNFFPNLHNVPKNEVLAAWERLNKNPLDGEIHIPAIRPFFLE